MKLFIITLLITCAVIDCNSQRLKAIVSKSDSTIDLIADIRRDHRIFGYKRPDTGSQKMILLSVFTADVEANPYKCPYGSYYQTSGMRNMRIKFLTKNGAFIKAVIIKSDTTAGIIYVLNKWIAFEK